MQRNHHNIYTPGQFLFSQRLTETDLRHFLAGGEAFPAVCRRRRRSFPAPAKHALDGDLVHAPARHQPLQRNGQRRARLRVAVQVGI
jgi:hypothetical protein